jgi:hypothetical protein
MSTEVPPAPSPPPPPVVWQTLLVASANLLNLALPRRVFYANQEPFSEGEYERKTSLAGGDAGAAGGRRDGRAGGLGRSGAARPRWHAAACAATPCRCPAPSMARPARRVSGLVTRLAIEQVTSMAAFASPPSA